MQKITSKLTSLHFMIPFFFFGIGMILLLNPHNAIKRIDVSDYKLMLLLLIQGHGVLFISLSLLLFQIRKYSIELYFKLTLTFILIITAIFLMTCYYYYLLPSLELILMGIITFLGSILIFYDRYSYKRIVEKEQNKAPKGHWNLK